MVILGKNPENPQKSSKKSKKPKWLLRNFLIYFYDFKKDDSISDWLSDINKQFIKYILDIIITGIKVQIALFIPLSILFYFTGFYVPLKLTPIAIISYGMIWDAWEAIHTELVVGKVTANSALRRN